MSYNHSINFKKFVAIIMLVIYGFVATPVQLWHSHNYSGIESSFKADKKDQVSESKSSGNIMEENCKICNHQYSSYKGGNVVSFTAALIKFSSNNSSHSTALPPSPLFDSTNKGPPQNG